jgi:hyperosmotically inducible periplasmic protein
MKTTLSSSRLVILLAITGALSAAPFLGGCASTATRDSTGEYVDDAIITTKVKKALLGDEAVKSFAVSVETAKDVVQLSGFVNTEEQRAAAGKDAWSVVGVKDVHNNLIVK